MWLANAITLARIPLGVVFWFTYGNLAWSIAVVGAAALSDSLDGTLARRARARTPSASTAGEWLDPLADKLFIGSVLAAIAVHGGMSWFAVALVLARDLVLAPLSLAYRLKRPGRAHAYQADLLGKATTILQICAVIAIIADLVVAPVLVVAACGFGLVAAAHYIVRSVQEPRLAT